MTASQIVETYYQYITSKCRLLVPRNKSLSEDLAQDCCLKILSMGQDSIDKLLQNPKAYIYRMLSTMVLDHHKHTKVREKFKAESLYTCDRHTHIDEFMAVSRLTQTDQLVLSVCIHYPRPQDFSRKTKISRTTSTKLINELKNKLSQ